MLRGDESTTIIPFQFLIGRLGTLSTAAFRANTAGFQFLIGRLGTQKDFWI